MEEEKKIIEHEQLTKEEFLEVNKELLEKYTTPIDENNKYITGVIGNKEDTSKANFQGIYIILEENKVIYIGSVLSSGNTITSRLEKHKYGHESNTKIVSYLMKEKGITTEEAKELIKTYSFIAFKYSSLEYLLISNTPGIINKSGNYK